MKQRNKSICMYEIISKKQSCKQEKQWQFLFSGNKSFYPNFFFWIFSLFSLIKTTYFSCYGIKISWLEDWKFFSDEKTENRLSIVINNKTRCEFAFSKVEFLNKIFKIYCFKIVKSITMMKTFVPRKFAQCSSLRFTLFHWLSLFTWPH